MQVYFVKRLRNWPPSTVVSWTPRLSSFNFIADNLTGDSWSLKVNILATGYLSQSQILPEPSWRQPLIGKTAAHRGRGRRNGPSSWQCIGEEFHQKWQHSKGESRRQGDWRHEGLYVIHHNEALKPRLHPWGTLYICLSWIKVYHECVWSIYLINSVDKAIFLHFTLATCNATVIIR